MFVIDNLANFATTVVNKLFPDKTEIERDKLAADLQASAQEYNLALGQIEVNKIEADNPNLFVSGWRPFIGWTCGFALNFNYIIGPYVVNPLLKHLGESSVPPMSMAELMPILLGLLGLGSMRTWERVKGVIPKGK